jgi:hypothetical protein
MQRPTAVAAATRSRDGCDTGRDRRGGHGWRWKRQRCGAASANAEGMHRSSLEIWNRGGLTQRRKYSKSISATVTSVRPAASSGPLEQVPAAVLFTIAWSVPHCSRSTIGDQTGTAALSRRDALCISRRSGCFGTPFGEEASVKRMWSSKPTPRRGDARTAPRLTKTRTKQKAAFRWRHLLMWRRLSLAAKHCRPAELRDAVE